MRLALDLQSACKRSETAEPLQTRRTYFAVYPGAAAGKAVNSAGRDETFGFLTSSLDSQVSEIERQMGFFLPNCLSRHHVRLA